MNLASRLRAGETVLSAWSHLPFALVAETLAGFGFGAVALDMQHGGHDEASVLASMGPIIARNSSPVVRIPVGRFEMASRALDMGAEAVIAPMINSLADARSFAAAVKFPPVGARSWGPFRAQALHGMPSAQAYLEAANRDTLAFAMIETREAVGIAGDLLAVEGIDGVLVGPSDLSIAWTQGRTVDPALGDMMPAIAEVAAAARGLGKLAAVYVADPAMAGSYARMGFTLIALGNEVRYMNDGARNLIDAARRSIG